MTYHVSGLFPRNHRLRVYVLVVTVALLVIFMANLNALVDLRFNPEIPYFAVEHLVVGGVSALVTLLLFGVLALHAGLLERALVTRRKDERALKESEEKYRSFFEQSKDAVFIASSAGHFLDINPAGVQMFGYGSRQEMLKLDIAHDLHVEYRDWFSSQEAIEKNGFLENHELRLKQRDGDPITVLATATCQYDETGQVIAYRGTMRDVTRQQMLESQVNQMRRMESIGRLAGGVAHDFNNHLTTISGRAEMALSGLNGDVELRENLEEILSSVDKASSLTRQLLLFGRSQPLNLQPIDINAAIRGTSFTLTRLLGDEVTVSLRLDENLAHVEADAANLELVVMNLVLHLVDSGSCGELLTISTGNASVDDRYALSHAEAYSGEFVYIDIVHSGYGGEPCGGGYIFEPFSGAGPNGRNGMGMAVAYGIVMRHGGWIEADGRQQQGSQYRVFLPAGTRPRETAGHGMVGTGQDRGKGERILLVEDEDAVRFTIAKMLEENGYEVTGAASAEVAFDLFVREAGDVQLLFSDVTLTGMSGVGLADHLRSHKPDLPVILCSGFTDQEDDLNAIRDHDYRFMQKPFSLPELLRAVKEVLGPHQDHLALK